MMLANGASGVTVDDGSYDAFVQALSTVCLSLALGIVRGGEGATKLITVNVTGAASKSPPSRIASSPGYERIVIGLSAVPWGFTATCSEKTPPRR